MIGVFRFHGPATSEPSKTATLLRKRKKVGPGEAVVIAADFATVTDASGTRAIETYRDLPTRRYVTLTRREADLVAIANPGSRRPVVLEDAHPWLQGAHFLNDSVASFDLASSIVRRYGGHFVSAADYCNVKWATICNALRRKNGLDARFHTAWHLPVQDVYILEELRPGRTVVAIDINGMYPSCMQQPFPKPSSLRIALYNRLLGDEEELPCGLYRCVLEGPRTEFIKKHNPFRSFFSGRYLGTGLTEPIEVDLNEFEVEYYHRHFRQVRILDALVADKVVDHPLAKEVRRSFSRRKNFEAQGNQALADREKYLATLMSSCANRPARSRRSFESRSKALDWLGAAYGVRPVHDEPDVAVDTWLAGRKGIDLRSGENESTVDVPDLEDGSACFALGQRIVARGRIALLRLMERVLELTPEAEICYVNIDSVHFSIPDRYRDAALNQLRAETSDCLGAFKIEAVTSCGLWLEPGRYWLFSDKVEKFRNRGIGDRKSAFRDCASYVTTRRLGDLHIPIKVSVRLERSMSDSRSLVEDHSSGLRRQRLLEVDSKTTFATYLDATTANRTASAPERIAAFRALRKAMEHPAPLS